ncbi:SDR family NAD(P)-dependent oxidoreductase [Lysinibacillus sp. NPDC097231]|uniref:SDR family NAD(P)-dependent oxidoreductase n=1 Tax=Lysinibacillus sp. NPDC097231 TaxID=3364142 RepID=UPI0037FA498A
MLIDLKGLKVIIIGASGTIGNLLFRSFIKEGAIVGGTYFNSPIVTEDINSDCYFINRVDVRDEIDLKKGLKDLIFKLGSVDVFIYNAGICKDNLLPFISSKDWNNVLNTNLNGAFLSAKIISKHFIINNHGKIIFISSVKGMNGSYGQSNYSASKAGLIGLSNSLAKELGEYGITVNTVCPGFQVTNLNREKPDKLNRAVSESVINKTLDINEIIDSLLFLCSKQIKNISGQVFHIDNRL